MYDPGLRPILEPLTHDLREVLGDDLAGLYLYGSAVSGGFDPGVSDLDLVAVTDRRVEDLDLTGLDSVHRRVVERDPSWLDRLEIVYVARGTLGGPIGQDPVAVISPGQPFHVTGPASDWLQNWYLVRETGVTLQGPPPKDLIVPLAWTDYLVAVRAYLAYLQGSDPSSYAVLSACRALRTIETGAPCSKQEGAAWVRERLPEWAWLIDLALEDRRTRGQSGFDVAQTRTAARRFVELAAMSTG
jgi:hypothetical protein